jgi:hypothetical protein
VNSPAGRNACCIMKRAMSSFPLPFGPKDLLRAIYDGSAAKRQNLANVDDVAARLHATPLNIIVGRLL